MNPIIRAIEEHYKNLHRAALVEYELKKSNIYTLIPDIEKIDFKIRKLGTLYNKKILTGELDAVQAKHELDARISKLIAQKQAILLAHSYPKNYLTLQYKCSSCEDTGYVKSTTNLTEGKSEKYNPLNMYSSNNRCHCYKQMMVDLLYHNANINLNGIIGFDNFSLEFYSKEPNPQKYGSELSPYDKAVEVKELCKKFVEGFNSNNTRNLYFCGNTGVGKTHMTKCIAIELMNKGYTVLYLSSPQLFDILSTQRFNFDYSESKNLYQRIMDVNLLIIDDLGTETETAARYAQFLTLLNNREVNNTRNICRTIISTNISQNRALYEHYSERIASRILGDFTQLKFIGTDIRLLKLINH